MASTPDTNGKAPREDIFTIAWLERERDRLRARLRELIEARALAADHGEPDSDGSPDAA
jgi:hypothetical protein